MTVDEFVVRHFRGRTLFHFTDTRNLPSIRIHGLLSRRELKERGVGIEAPGGNQWSHDADDRAGLDQFIHLCFFDDHPMDYVAKQAGHIRNSKFLGIHTNILNAPGVKMSLDVSNKAGVEVVDLLEGLSQMDTEVVFKSTDWKDPKIKERLKSAKKYEILVPKAIPRNLIGGL